MNERNYWGYRIDTSAIDYFTKELREGRLRQGWGWHEEQNLRIMKKDEGASKNLPMMNRVKKGDILIIPRLPDWDHVTIAEALDDWDKAYEFSISAGQIDYGHIFPAREIRNFVRNSPVVKSEIRTTLHARQRFWNVNYCSSEIEEILCADEDKVQIGQTLESRMESVLSTSFLNCFEQDKFCDELYKKMIEHFSAETWEFALVHGFRMLFPFYDIEHVGGKSEEKHGTDILIKLPDIFSESCYCIAIQVKDHGGFIADEVIEQINKADRYWREKDLIVVDKIVIITKAEQVDNLRLLNNKDGVKFYFASDLKKLLLTIGKNFIGINDNIIK
jgi:hypothetical protein